MPPVTGEVTVCENTGLALLPAGGQTVYRLAKPSYGVLNPRARGVSSSEDRAGWNRFDLPGEQTVYCAGSAEGAYGELLGALKVGGPYRAQEYLDDPGEEDLYALIARDFNDLGVRPPGVVDIGWLYAHRLYTVALPALGWFVEVEHARTITYLASHIPVSLWERGVDEITVAQTRSGDRHLTTELAATLAAAPPRRRRTGAGHPLLLQARHAVVLLGGVAARGRRWRPGCRPGPTGRASG